MVTLPKHLGLALGLVTLAAIPAQAQSAAAGRVVSLRGDVQIDRSQTGGANEAVTPGREIREGDVIKTAKGASARLLMRDKGILDLGAETRVTIRTYTVQPALKQRKVSIYLTIGRLWARVSKSLNNSVDFEVASGNAVAGVRGTEFVTDVSPEGQTTVTVVEGAVQVGAPNGPPPQLLGAMQRGDVGPDGTVSVTTVSQGDIQTMERSVQSSTTLDPASSDQRIQGAENAPPGEPGAPAPQTTPTQNPGEQTPPVTEPPPLNLDPSTGKSTVRGTLEIRE